MRPLARLHAEALQRREVEILLVTSDRHPESDAARDYEMVVAPGVRTLRTWPASYAAWRRIQPFHADIVVAEIVRDPRWIAFAGRVPRVQLIHDDRPHDPGEQLPAYERAVFERWGARSAATVVFSEYVAEALADRRDIVGTRLETVPLTSDLDPGLVAPPVPASARRDFVLIGRLNPYKNIEVVLDAWRLHVTGSGWRGDNLVLIGDGSPLSRPLPEHTVHRSGAYRYSDVVDTLAAAKGSVAHYRRASQSGVQVLSMQIGVMPIVSTAGALPEYQPLGCPPVDVDDVAGLRSTFDRLADPHTAALQGAAAAAHYASHFTADHAARRLLDVLAAAAGEGDNSSPPRNRLQLGVGRRTQRRPGITARE
jgi:glycosyltransferase involved in cell wall biosynthesis